MRLFTKIDKAPWLRRMSGKRAAVRLTARLLVVVLLVSSILLSGCKRAGVAKTAVSIARYGSLGKSFALKLAEAFPFRSPGSTEEAAAADYLIEELQRMNINAEKQSFDCQDSQGAHRQSANIIFRISGRGFSLAQRADGDPLKQSAEMQAPASLDHRLMIIGAHYDVVMSREEALSGTGDLSQTAETDESGLPVQRQDGPQPAATDGIHDNAAAVATLLLTAQLLKENSPGYDVIFVLFGAGHAGQAGAEYFAKTLSQDEIARCDAMINLDSIYAGDKVYAHAGLNSVRAGQEKSYSMRRKLYECTDVYYENLLLTRNGFALFTNQSGCPRDMGDAVPSIYREWSEHVSDHRPFDRLGIPIVFFDSGNYDLENCEQPFRESSDPYFSSVNGVIKGSAFDSSALLLSYFRSEGQGESAVFGSTTEETSVGDAEAEGALPEESKTSQTQVAELQGDRLQVRINNLAFILTETSRKGPPGAILHSESAPKR